MAPVFQKPKHTVLLFGVFLLTMAALLAGSQVVTTQFIEKNRQLVILMNNARQHVVQTERVWRSMLDSTTQADDQALLWRQWDEQHRLLVDTRDIPFAEFSFVPGRRNLVQTFIGISENRAGNTSASLIATTGYLGTYSDLMNDYANALESYVQSKADRLEQMKIFFAGIIMLVLILEVSLIFYPAHQRERNTQSRLEEANFELQQNVEELQTREEELSQNLEEITALQDQLANSENRYRNLVESSQDIIYELADTGQFNYINPTFTMIIGYNREEAYKMGYWEMVQEDYREEVVRFYYEQIKHLQPDSYLEIPVTTKEGELRWLGQNVKIEFKGEWVTRVFAIARDITELKKVQEQLQDSEQQYRLLSENARDLVALHDPDGTVLYVSNSIQELLGYGPEEFMGTKLQDHMHPEDLAALRKQFQEHPENQRENRNSTFRIQKRNGNYIWFETSTKPILDENGEVDYLQTASRDVTSRKEVEAQLIRQKEMLSEAQRMAKMASWEYDRKTKKFYVADEFETILPGVEYQLGIPMERYMTYIHPEDVAKQGEAFRKALRDAQPYDMEVRHLLPTENTVRTLAFRAQPQTDEHGVVVRIMGSMQDVSQARRQQELLQRKQNELVAFIKAAPAAMAMFDAELRYITASNRWTSDFGLGAEDITGQNHYDLLPSWNPVWRNNQTECLLGTADDSIKRPFRTLIKEKEEWVKWECKPWQDMQGQVGGIILYAELITEQLREEREQQVQQLRMQTIYRVVSKISGNLEEQISDVLSIATEELGLRVGMIGQIFPEENQFVIQDVYDPAAEFTTGANYPFSERYCEITYQVDSIVAIDSASKSSFHEHQAYRTSGWETYIGVTLYVKGVRYGTLSFSAPEARSKPFRQIDKDYVQLVGQWIAAALERAQFEREIIESKEKAEAATEAKAQFLSMMSHEIRTPLNAVIGMTHLLIQEQPRPDQLENLKTLRFSGENLLVLVNDILDFSKIEAGKITLEKVPFRLQEILQGIHNSLGYRAQEKGIDLVLTTDSSLPVHYLGDPVRLSQVITNLTSNAVKFTEKGKVELSAQILSTQDSVAQIRFEVHDTGIGIPAEKKESIFESFIQARSDTTRRYGGTGLGLAITKRLLDLMGSTIELESDEGKGSIFAFNLTIDLGTESSQPTYDAEASQEQTEELLQQIKVLLVEDNPVNQLVAT
ncbi:MAG: PAS domain S-box protein, partial [Bacteroidota bacterium]